MALTAQDIADTYKQRWQIELLFYGKQFIMQSKRFHLFEAA
jgi:IS4 transposase